jgi:hypothetical protein
MTSDSPDDGVAELVAQRARLVAALERGGYWRASLRLDPATSDPLQLEPAAPVVIEWEVPRSLDRFPAMVVRDLRDRGLTLFHGAYVVVETATGQQGGLPTIRLAPFQPEYWESVQPGDELTGRRLGVATLIEYVLPPAEPDPLR